MSTTFFLIRHAAHEDVGRCLTGRRSGVHLGRTGHVQAQRLAERMAFEPLMAVYSSPRERALETASPIAIACEVGPVTLSFDLDEIDFGSWSGKMFSELEQDEDWRRWNELREQARTPSGETMAAVQKRAVSFMQMIRRRHHNEAVALVSHADVLKAIVCQVLGLSVGHCFRFDIVPASISSVVMGDWGAKLLALNETL
jgi:probable phosphoglycerate mutase